jgi:hypothetical protein
MAGANHLSFFVPVSSNGCPWLPPTFAVYDRGLAYASNQAPDEAALSISKPHGLGDTAMILN